MTQTPSSPLTIRQEWQRIATANGKGDDYVTVRLKDFPPTYKFSLDWGVATLKPIVMNPDVSPAEAEIAYYRELMKLFSQRAWPVMERIKKIDNGQHKRISTFLKRINEESPSTELLGHYNTYIRTIDSMVDAKAQDEKQLTQLEADVESKLVEMSKHYYKVLYAGKAFLYDVRNDCWASYKDYVEHYAHWKVSTINPDTGKYVTKNIFTAFKEWDKAPRFDTVTFNPMKDGHYDNVFNLWQGLSVTPIEGDDDLPVWELLHKICNDNTEYFEYVQKWLAHMVQKPWELPGTAIGISGKQGLGKNAFIETIGMLFSSEAAITKMRNNDNTIIGTVLGTGAFGYFSSYDQVFGTFNALAGNKILLFLDEATWGGFHAQKSSLKTAITGQTVIINDKFMKHLVVPNNRRIMLASNDGFYYGADADDRRLLPLEFKEENRPSEDWFKQFYALRKNSKMLENLMHRLKTIDITTWNPMQALRAIEITTGEAIQQASAPEFQHWMDEVADTGHIILPTGDKEFPEMIMPVCSKMIFEDDLRRAFQYYVGAKDMNGWNKHDFSKARNFVFGEKTRGKKTSESRPYMRNIPAQSELQQRLDSQYKWKRNRFKPIEDDQSTVLEFKKKAV